MITALVTQVSGLFLHQVLPLFLLVAFGYFLMRRFRLDVQTLNKLNLYVFVPGVTISSIMRFDFSTQASWRLSAAYLFHTLLLVLAGLLLARLNGRREEVITVGLASGWGNSGNFGLPLAELALGAAAVPYQVLLMVLNGLTLFTAGLGLITAGRLSADKAWRSIAGQPVIYSLAFALLLKSQGWQLPQPLAVSINYLGDGMIPVAILTLGAQLAVTRRATRGAAGHLWLAVALRLIAAPLVALPLIPLFGLAGLTAKVLLIGSAVPVAVNTAILAIEYRSQERLAARAVLWSTILCALTLPLVIYLANLLY